MNFLIANRGYAMEIASETDAFPSSKHRNLCAGISDTCSAGRAGARAPSDYRAGTDTVCACAASLSGGPYSVR